MTQPNEEKNAPDTITDDDPLRAITARLKLYYDQWKQGERDKNTAKSEFFKEVSQRVQCDERLITIEAASDQEACELIAQRYPLWILDDIRPSDKQDGASATMIYEAIIVENSEFKKFTYFNPDNRMIYERQIAQGAPVLDDEKLMTNDPDLYERVTFVPEPERQLKPFEELDDLDLAALQDYMYEGKPSTRLAAPRKATEEELSELE